MIPPPPSVEKLPSMKPVPSAKNVGNRLFNGHIHVSKLNTNMWPIVGQLYLNKIVTMGKITLGKYFQYDKKLV